MSFEISENTLVDKAASFIASSISQKLANSKKVLFFIAGGSSLMVAIKVAKILKQKKHENLTITLTDERYGEVDHTDSNWHQLMSKGFDLPQAKLIPILSGENLEITTKNFNKILAEELHQDYFKIGLFGIGPDGHTAGILPYSGAVNSNDFAFGYKTENFTRITMTPKAIALLDEIVVYAEGKNKWGALAKLKDDLPLNEEPAQSLKKAKLLIMFSDYQNSVV